MARKQLNKNVVIGLTLFSFFVIIVASVLMLRQLQARDPQYYVDLADQYAGQGDFKTAAVFYREAWQRSQDPVHLVRHGDMQLKEGAVREAVASWRLALVNDPTQIDAHRRQLDVLLEMARLYRRLESWDAVREAAEAFLNCGAELPDADRAFAHHADGLALTNLTRRDPNLGPAGEAELRKATELAPVEVPYAIDLARFLVTAGRRDEAAALFDELLAKHEPPGADAARVRLGQAELLAANRRFEEAETALQAALAAAEHDAEALREARLGYAGFLTQHWARLVREGDDARAEQVFAQAEQILRQSMETDPDRFEPYLNLSVLYRAADRHEDVLTTCRARLSRGFSRRGVEADRTRLHAFNLMLYAAEACVAQSIIAHQAGDQETREALLMQAEQFVTDARGEFPSHPRVFHDSARIKLARGLDRAALEDLRQADEAYSGFDTIDWENKIILARLHLKLGEAGAARSVLEETLDAARTQRRNDANFWTIYAQSLYETGELDRALALAEQILAGDADHEGALRLKAAVLERQGRYEDATRIVEALTGSEMIRPLRASQRLSLAGNAAEAVAVLREALARQPGEVMLVRAIVRELINLGREQEARDAVQAALAVHPEDATLKRLAVLTQPGLTPAERDEALIEVVNTQPDAYQRAAELIGIYWRRGDHAQALAAVDAALDHLQKKDTPAAQDATIEVQRALITAKLALAAAMKDDEAAREARDFAVRYNVDGAHGQAIAGQYHLQRNEIDPAIKALRRAVEEQPTDSRALSLLGQAHHYVGQLEEARDMYERAVSVNPREGDAHRGLAMLAKQSGDGASFARALAAAEQYLPNDPWVVNERLLRQEQADPSAAIAQREAQLADKPDDVQNLGRLAELCDSVGNQEKADRYFERLLEVQGDNKDIVVAVSGYFRRTDRAERSLSIVNGFAESRTTPEDRANAHILIASHYLHVGDDAAVERALLNGADIELTFEVAQSLAEFYFKKLDRADRALPWLDRAVELARRTDAARVPRTLSTRIACLLDRDVDDIARARQEVDALLANHPDYLPALLLKSEVHARAGEVTEAIDALNTYLNRKADDANALYQRALHRRAQGQLGAAIEDLERLKRVHPLALDLAPRLLLANLHRQTGRHGTWIRELELLLADAPDSPAAVEALARAYVQQNRAIDAERIVTGQINRAGQKPDPRWFFLRGSIALEMGDPQKALADFRRGAEADGYSADAVAGVLDVYLRMNRPADGLTYYEQHAPDKHQTATLLSRHARCLAAAGREAEALAQFRDAMAVAMAESNESTRQVAADVRAVLDPSRAVALFTASSNAGDRAVQRLLARLYPMTGRFAEAGGVLNQLIQTSDSDVERAELHSELGEVHQLSGQHAEARSAYEEALKYNDRHWVALNNLAYLLSDAMNEHALARPYAERAVAIQEHPSALDTLGWIYVGLADYSAAVAELSRSIRLNPDDPLPYFHLGEAYRRSGQMREAIDILQSGLDVARSAGQAESVTSIESAIERVRAGDQSP